MFEPLVICNVICPGKKVRIGSKSVIRKVSKHCSVGILVLAVTGCINNSAFRSLEHAEPIKLSDQNEPLSRYKVQRGDTLYSIALAFDLDHRALAHANNIMSPFIIFPGQTLSLEVTDIPKQPPKKAPSGDQNISTQVAPQATPTPSGSQKTDTPPVVGQKSQSQEIRWIWPSNGKIVRTFNPKQTQSKGVDMPGQLGEPVFAAAAGKVVFAGSGLRGYGNLVIIEHNQEFLSAYAYTNKILVAEMETVKAGQQIAEIGSSGTAKQPMLHFEIRRQGKPVDPALYLPKRK